MIAGTIKTTTDILNLSLTLTTGQNFRWRKQPTDSEWIGIIDNRYVVSLCQHSDQIDYRVLNSDLILQNSNQSTVKRQLHESLLDYFWLDEDISTLYSSWSELDVNFAKISSRYKGIRLLRQDVTENIISFICSSNNNISRISKMVEALCNNYGSLLYSKDDVEIYSFPQISNLATAGVEANLRKLGFGSKFIFKTCQEIMHKSNGSPEEWIAELKKMEYGEAKGELMSLPGIGAKVADCICLMSLGFTEAIPVDTHVLQITARHYLPSLKACKSVTTKQYNQIGDFYRQKFQPHPGWAQTVLFCSDLKLKHS